MNNKKLFSYIAQVFIGNQSDGDYLDKQLLVFWHVCIPFLAWMYYKINSYWILDPRSSFLFIYVKCLKNRRKVKIMWILRITFREKIIHF